MGICQSKKPQFTIKTLPPEPKVTIPTLPQEPQISIDRNYVVAEEDET
ncbi:hypothetical protein pb186bvf_000819 [Paramecium bursaria]